MRIAAGELAPDAGTVSAERVELVHQHFMLVNAFSIAENLALVLGLDRPAAEVIASTGIALADPSRLVADLSVGEKSKLELIKAIARAPRVLILDEPTSVLTPTESEELFRVMRRLASEGTAVVFISHKLPEVLAVATRIVVMRRGAVVETTATSAEELAQAFLESGGPGHRSSIAQEARRPRPPHSITAIVGVAGNGQQELAAKLRRENTRRAAFIPEDRTRDGLVAEMTLAENVALTADRWHPREAANTAQRLIDLYSIRARSPKQRAGELSGGNQQKLILARELDRDPELIVAAEPTRGLDIEATRFVHDQLRAAAARGAEIVLITSDLDEAFALADTLQVIYRGRLSEPMTPDEARTRVASLMAGVS